MRWILMGALGFLGSLHLQAQSGIEQVLRQIEKNHKELRANEQRVTAQRLEAGTDNNLADPTVSYTHLWQAKDRKEYTAELEVVQEFDFPSLYTARKRLNRLKGDAFESQAALLRQETLLQAKEICLDIIMLRQQKELLEGRLSRAKEQEQLYTKQLEKGGTGIFTVNKIRLVLLNIRTETALNETTLRNKLQELQMMNGNIPVTFEEKHYPPLPFPTNYEQLRAEVAATDRSMLKADRESKVARKQVAVNRSGWLPKLGLGYRRDMIPEVRSNGVILGISLPIFENRNRVKMAKAQALQMELQQQHTELLTMTELEQLYREAETLHTSMEEYHRTFDLQKSMALLKQALTGGQINMIDYFVEVDVLYESLQNYFELENRYQKVMARIYKGRL